jgi:small subunit ribosomal protein S3Ae
MAKAKKAAKEVLKWKKKKWIKIISPKEFGNVILGESLVLKADQLVGKTIEVNLMSITRDIKKQNVNVKFVIVDIVNNQAVTKLMAFKIVPSSIKRMIRRGKDRIDMSFLCKTKEGLLLRIKLLLITMNNTSNSVLSTLRKKAEFLITQHSVKTGYDELMEDIIFLKIQKELKRQLKSIYPLKTVEVKNIQVQKKDDLFSKVKKKVLKEINVENENKVTEEISENKQLKQEKK